ncbi:uncharacterized protein LOC124865549 isoform X2 [Girardinichthys multiradiatus]|uniref:uncharacterized protein LOC124865549 isoform X2 n=1 Tax=Girardinichthys multiradiatus TaxID=208333 RepID=UPI001FACE56C|nr:uncharacterized protein LOC124865549 isoform X2 [Girardinichthys multiradiatus]XP_047216686.1 uncharacterized protein LOC124865549 isoform X2 [Girardinichthys multiradiatus]
MRSLILVVVVVFVVNRILETNGFHFGDTISFKTRCRATFRYQHFAVYVGKGNVHNLPKTDAQDIYERLKSGPTPQCVFSELSQYEEPRVENYLDDYTDPETKITFKRGTDDEIRERIIETNNNCDRYNLLSNNCEHHANYVRYGHKIAEQFKLTGEGLCFNNPRINTQALGQYLRESCSSDPAG